MGLWEIFVVVDSGFCSVAALLGWGRHTGFVLWGFCTPITC